MKKQEAVKRNRYSLRALTDSLGMVVVLIALVAFFSAKSENFLTTTNFLALANQIPAAILIAVGMTFVLIIAGIDLSVGSVVGISGAVLGILLDRLGAPLPVAIIAGLLAGLVCGAINGMVIVRWSLPPFIVTLGMLEVARGGTFLLTQTRTIYLGSKIGGIAEAGLGNISVLFILAIAIAIVAQLVLDKSRFGRYMVAIGTNEKAAYLSGINTSRIKLAVYATSGLLCALAALVNTARMASANPNAGTGFELEAIAAVVVGGTSLMGGRGSVVNSLFGVLIMAVLSSGLSQIGAEEASKRMITGCVIVLAVILDYYRTKLTSKREAAK